MDEHGNSYVGVASGCLRLQIFMTTRNTQQALVTDWTHVASEQVADGIKRQMVVGQNVMIVRFTFDPFVVTDEHTHPHEQMTLVIQGRVKFAISGSEHVAVAGDVLHFPPDSRHGATMLDEKVVLIDIFSPMREEFLS